MVLDSTGVAILATEPRWRGRPVGPEQVAFLRYRPVLSNRRLKEEMGYVPQRTTAEVLEGFARARGMVLA